MNPFKKVLQGVTYPFRKAGGAVGGKMAQAKRWVWSKTIGMAILSLATAAAASLLGDLEFQALVEGWAPWALPVLMIILRLVTKGPVTK